MFVKQKCESQHILSFRIIIEHKYWNNIYKDDKFNKR